MNKRKYFLTAIVLVLLLLNGTISSFATANTYNSKATPPIKVEYSADGKMATIYVEQSTSKELISSTVSELLSNNKLDGVAVVDQTLLNSINSKVAGESLGISPKAGGISYYFVTNVRPAPEYIGSVIESSTGGAPGVTVKLDISRSISHTVSSTFGASANDISAAVGWSITGSHTVTNGGSYLVPQYYDGKKVVKGFLDAKPYYLVKKFDVYYTGQGQTVFKGTGEARYPLGYYFPVRHTF